MGAAAGSLVVLHEGRSLAWVHEADGLTIVESGGRPLFQLVEGFIITNLITLFESAPLD